MVKQDAFKKYLLEQLTLHFLCRNTMKASTKQHNMQTLNIAPIVTLNNDSIESSICSSIKHFPFLSHKQLPGHLIQLRFSLLSTLSLENP